MRLSDTRCLQRADRAWLVLALLSVAAFASGCKKEPALLIKATADAQVQKVDVYVRDDDSQQIIFHSGFQDVLAPGQMPDPGTDTRDLTKEPLKIALKLSKGGKFTVLLVGVIGAIDNGKPALGATQLFWAGRYDVTGATDISARLLTVPPGDDADGDLFPDMTAFPMHVPEAATLYGNDLDLLDCDDKTDDPISSTTGKPVMVLAANINPFAVELCGDGFDEDCNGNGDEPCVDADKDGDPKGDDCDDNDATRHHPTTADPFPDPPNCCGYSLGKMGTAQANTSFLGQPICPKERCGDGIDESCRGQGPNDAANDTTCVVDMDCDGYPAGVDCNDNDPNIHPGAKEICGNGIDDSCSGRIDAGCVACDLDGDGYERSDAAAGCPDKTDTHPGMVDCNDYDAGVYPGSTAAAGGKEGGINPQGKIATGVKGLCRRIYNDTGLTGTAKIGIAGYTVGDADCNGVAYEGCPDPACDADGDGFSKDASCGDTAGPYDCNDNDPTIFPGAPDKCGDNVASDCLADTPCSSGVDADGDGYFDHNQGGPDCDDTKASTHPFALELCNGNDDDCDGDKDEGNPDGMGNALITGTAITSCTDSNVGACATAPIGTCVCSGSDPKSTINTSDRNACPTDVTGMLTPHCYGAHQPSKQTCTAVDIDDDCNGTSSDLTGANLLEEGQPCGLNVGPCKEGTVSGCDRTQTTSPYYGALATPDEVHLICKGTINPTAEVCDGIDDDCNGVIPATEADADMDHYIACSPCDASKLAMGLLGCGDCNDSNPNVHPGAPDICNGINDDCNAATADGSADCTPAGKACCNSDGGGNTCYDLTSNALYCGSCAAGLTGGCENSVFVNACSNSTCVCGSMTGPCGSSTWCNGGACSTCNTNAHCGPQCAGCGTNQVCKSDGSACTGCNVDNDCGGGSTQYCGTDGNCHNRIPKGSMCTSTGNPEQPEHTCATGLYCTDGYCCDKPPSQCGLCKSCALMATAGTCTNTPAGSESGNECVGNMATCTGDKCNGNASCAVMDTTACGTPSCDGSNDVVVDECSGGTCSSTPSVVKNCGLQICLSGACTACTSDASCGSGHYCWPTSIGGDGNCYPNHTAGYMGCTGDGDCNSGACVYPGTGSKNVCCGTTGRPGSCVSDTSTCNTTTDQETTYTCPGSNYNACTANTGSCSNNLGCANSTSCNTNCHSNADCASGYYCPNSGATSCNACNTTSDCGSGCVACNPMCSGSTITGGSCTGGACSGTGACPGNFACADGTSCNTNCAKDSDCASGNWCKKGGGGTTCQPQIASNSSCNDNNCEQSGCMQCTGGMCPGGNGSKCP